jgi:hypothetical protein
MYIKLDPTHARTDENIILFKDWSKLFVRFIRNNLNQVEVISSW